MSEFWDRLEKIVVEPCKNFLATGDKTRKVPVDLRSGDFVVVGSMKTGTTWVQQIFHQIRTGGDEDFDDIYSVVPFIPFFYMDVPGLDLNITQKALPRGFKSHEMYDQCPRADGVKYIVVTRDPVDCLWSMIKFLRRFYSNEDADMSLEDVQRFLTSPMVTVSGSNQDFMLSWWPHRNDPNVLWLFFEDLKKDLSTCVDRIAQFMGVEMTTKLKEKVLEFSSFEYMLKNKEKFQGEEHFVSRPVQGGQLDSTWKPQMGMVRADGGQIGQGRTGIPPPILHLIQQRWDESVGKAFNFPTYEDMYKAGTILKD